MRKLKMEELGRLSPAEFAKAPKYPLVLVLDNIRSMHNVGAIFRTADAFSVAHIYLCGITARPPHRDIRKSALGAEETVPWTYVPEALLQVQTLKEAGHHILALEQTVDSTALGDFRPEATEAYALVLGHEVKGVDQALLDLTDTALEIPQYGTKHSLNVSVAAGIAMYQLVSNMGTSA